MPVPALLNTPSRRNWYHGSLRGATSLAQRRMNEICSSETCTPEARALAADIADNLARLAEALKTRNDV